MLEGPICQRGAIMGVRELAKAAVRAEKVQATVNTCKQRMAEGKRDCRSERQTVKEEVLRGRRQACQWECARAIPYSRKRQAVVQTGKKAVPRVPRGRKERRLGRHGQGTSEIYVYAH